MRPAAATHRAALSHLFSFLHYRLAVARRPRQQCTDTKPSICYVYPHWLRHILALEEVRDSIVLTHFLSDSLELTYRARICLWHKLNPSNNLFREVKKKHLIVLNI
jgi:hypothetical protein